MEGIQQYLNRARLAATQWFQDRTLKHCAFCLLYLHIPRCIIAAHSIDEWLPYFSIASRSDACHYADNANECSLALRGARSELNGERAVLGNDAAARRHITLLRSAQRSPIQPGQVAGNALLDERKVRPETPRRHRASCLTFLNVVYCTDHKRLTDFRGKILSSRIILNTCRM